MEAITTAFETGLTTIQTSAMGMIGTALPPALAILGAFVAVKLGIRFFRSVTG